MWPSECVLHHITKADAVRDIDTLLQKAAAGAGIITESETELSVVLRLTDVETEESRHAQWFFNRVQEALDDRRATIPHEEVAVRSAKKFAEARRKELEATGRD